MLTRHLSKIAVTLVLAALAAPTAMATGGAATVIRNGRSPDTIDAALVAHSGLAVADGRSPDTRDASLAAQAPALITYADGRSPDTIDAALQAHSPVVTVVRSPGFDWTDFSVGVAAALGAMLLFRLSTSVFGSRRKTSPAATA